MKIFRIFTIAAAALMMAACSTDDIAQLFNGGKKNFTATIAAPNSGATTRTEYTEVTTGEAAGTINVAWKVGDEIALIHNGVKDVATVKTVNADGSATITGFITSDTQDGTDVKLVYPAEFLTIIDDEPYFDKMRKQQDGTLKYIQDNLDYRDGSGHLSVKESGVTLSEPVTMKSGIAIWKLTLMNGSVTPAAALEATKVTITKGNETLASTATLAQGKSEWTLAIPLLITDPSLTIEATDGEDTYTYTKAEGVTFTANTYYQNEVTLTKQAATDLSKLTGDYTAKNGETLTGTLNGSTQPYKISIAAGATVTLDDVTINGVNNESYKWAGITCDGDAIIILKGTNTVKGFYNRYPGIHPAVDHKLTIKGTGSLTASSNGAGAGIGGGWPINCGNIEIQGGTITANGGCGAGIGSGDSGSCGSITISGGTVTANGGDWGAGIGCGYGSSASCGDITISGGTVTATGGDQGVGIGGGKKAKCGDITITTGVTKVTANKGSEATYSIGAGNDGSCGTVTIGGVVGAISTSPYTYDPNAPALNLTSPAVGQVIGDDGKNYDYASLPGGVTAVAKICYVSGSNGLALALADEGKMNWSTAISTCAAHTPAFTGGTWKLATKDEWTNMITAAGSYTALRDGFTSVGGSNLLSDVYWSSTESGSDSAWVYYFDDGDLFDLIKGNGNVRVRACLAF